MNSSKLCTYRIMSFMYIHVQNESLSMIANFLLQILQYHIVKQNVTLEFLNIITLLGTYHVFKFMDFSNYLKCVL